MENCILIKPGPFCNNDEVVFDNLMFGEFSKDTDENMSDSNIGSRRKRNTKDHLIIIHGFINSVNKDEDGVWISPYLT